MTDIWSKKKRTHWKKDEIFLKYEKYLLETCMSFEEICEHSLIDSYIKFKKDKTGILKEMKKEWLKLIKEWNSIRKVDSNVKTYMFVGLCYLFVVLPYDEIYDIKVFSVFDISMINVCYYYVKKKYLEYEGAENLFDIGPLLPAAYMEWIDDRYDSATWWLCYSLYERRNGLKPLVDSKPTKKI